MNGYKVMPIIAILGVITLGAVFTQTSSAKEAAESVPANQPQKVFVLKAVGMTCGSCEARITDALRSFENVGRVAVSISKGLVAVEAADAPGTAVKLSSVVTGAGYPASHVGFLAAFPTEGRSAPQGKQSGCGGGCCSPG
jgi:copper chaperone CopZ